VQTGEPTAAQYEQLAELKYEISKRVYGIPGRA